MTSSPPLRALLLTLALQAGCAASTPMQRPDEPLIDERTGEPSSPSSPAPPSGALAPAPPSGALTPAPPPAPPFAAQAAVIDASSPPGTIRREQLKAVLAGSPGAFLARIETEPTFSGATFRGWRIRSFFPGDPRLGGALRPGDVVVKVNDHAIERPEQFGDVWAAAAGRPDLTVDLVREGRPLRLAWRIVDPTPSPASPAPPPPTAP